MVIDALGDWTRSECSGTGGLLIMEGSGPLCLTCAELDHLVFLPAGDAALTRRGILIEEEALVRAEQECLADEEARRRRQARNEQRRADQDAAFQAAFAHRQLLDRDPGPCGRPAR